jgi:hypothetical protein
LSLPGNSSLRQVCFMPKSDPIRPIPGSALVTILTATNVGTVPGFYALSVAGINLGSDSASTKRSTHTT